MCSDCYLVVVSNYCLGLGSMPRKLSLWRFSLGVGDKIVVNICSVHMLTTFCSVHIHLQNCPPELSPQGVCELERLVSIWGRPTMVGGSEGVGDLLL